MKSAQTTALEVRGALKEGIARLQSAGTPSAALAAELLLMHALGRDRTWMYAHSEEALSRDAAEVFFALIARRAAGEPTQYLTGRQEFWGLDFQVTPAVLIPRPETEHLIEVAVQCVGKGRSRDALRIADVGTGSGCIAVALAKEFPSAQIVATDISRDALEVARRNAVRHAVANQIQFLESDLLALLPHDTRPFDLIVSNPPYIARDEAATLPREVREHEPEIALFGGPTGVEIYSRLIAQAAPLLAAGGALVLELGYDSADRVAAMIEAAGCWRNLAITKDLAGIPRVLFAARS